MNGRSNPGTIFLGSGFAAKYRLGGGNFSVPLQWALALQKLGLDFIWLEHLPASKDPAEDQACIDAFRARLVEHGLGDRFCLLHQNPAGDDHDLAAMTAHGLTGPQLEDRLAGPNTLLNLSYSFHPPFLLCFERRLFCDLDPTEISFWMDRVEMGQSSHHEFWSIGLNRHAPDCLLPTNGLAWKTFFPLVDTTLNRVAPRPAENLFTTIGQWYWANNIEVNGEFPDLSKKAKFEPFLTLPGLVPDATMELAMNLGPGNPERTRLESCGWRLVEPHDVASSPALYRDYLRGALGEFTTIKGVDTLWRSGWVSDRAAAFLSLGRPVITEDAAVSRYLPEDSGFMEISSLESAREAIRRTVDDWPALSRRARATAEEYFEGTKTLRRMLGLG